MNLYAYAGNNPISFSDPFGLCPERVGGDGKTSTVDDCSQEIKDNWRSIHIHNTSSNNTDLDGVDPRLMDAVVRASMALDVDFGINAGKEDCCGHSADGGHKDGLAVDINKVGGTRFNQMSSEARARVGNQVGVEIVNRLPMGATHIIATPGIAFDTKHPVVTLDRLQRLLTEHAFHVHVTVFAP